jgi:hypothetical protein
MARICTVIAAVLFAATAWGGEQDPTTKPAKPTAPTTQPAAKQKTVNIDRLVFTVPADWEVQQPKSSMRKAQFRLPGSDAKQDAEVVVFYFGQGPRGGGGIDANIDRWCGQLAQPDGRSSKEVAKITQETFNGLKVHSLDVSGILVAPVSPGDSKKQNKPNQRMLASIVVTPEGNYFIKSVGPKSTLDAHADSYKSFIQSVMRK